MANPSSIALKRIFNDIKDLNKDPLDKEGIYHYYDESNVMTAKIMMIGPEDTPYENGFYFFNFTFPNDYPFNPPAVKYETRHGNIRFNPNLYTCGKVCLSLINTWEGPKWTSCQTIRSVLISLRGLVLGTKHPLQNEPGYESVTDTRSISFNEVINHENFHVAVVKMIQSPPPGFEVFLPKMIEHLKSKYPWYHKRLTELSKYDGTKVNSIYSMSITRNFSQQLKDIQHILNKNGMKVSDVKMLEEKPKEYEHNPNGPNQSANDYYAGYKLISEKDGKTYMVKDVFHNEKKIKTWVETTPMEVPVVKVIPKEDKKEESVKEDEKKSKIPNKSAKDVEVGKIIKSENDDRYYIVKEIGAEGKKYKRWVLAKNDEVKNLSKEEILQDTKAESLKGSTEQPKVSSKQEKTIGTSSETPKEMNVIVGKSDEKSEDSSSDKKKGERKAPKQSASLYEVGYELKSENDGKMYVVKSVGKEGKEFKRWVLKK